MLIKHPSSLASASSYLIAKTKTMNTLIVKQLSKTYPSGIKALDQVSLHLENGLFGLLGANGAGKSTFMRCLATLQRPDAGHIMFNDTDVLTQPAELRKALGYLPQEFGVYPRITAFQLMDQLAILKGIPGRKARREMVNHLLEKANLYTERHRAVTSFSGGMKRRLGIAQALIGQPRLLIVDEPTAGLDPGERHRFYNLLAGLGEEAIVLLSTHIVEDVRQLCPHMAIMAGGRIIYAGEPQAAVQELEGRVWQKQAEWGELGQVKAAHTVISSRLSAGRLIVRVFSEEAPVGFVPARPGLEEVFFVKTMSRVH